MSKESLNKPFRQPMTNQSRSSPSSPSSDQTASRPRRPSSRKASIPENRTSPDPRDNHHSLLESSSSSFRSIDSSNPPTSISTPLTLIQKSLVAARTANKSQKSDDLVLHVIRRSRGASGSLDAPQKAFVHASSMDNRTSLIDHLRVSSAPSPAVVNKDRIVPLAKTLRKVEGSESMQPPPRKLRGRESEMLAALVRPYLVRNPDTKLWSCVELLSGAPKRKIYAMIILNQPVTRKDVFLRAWDASE